MTSQVRWRHIVSAAALTAAFGLAQPVEAAHPMLTEDTGTQGAGRFELELGLETAREGGVRAFEFGPQLSYGLSERFDVIVRPTWLHLSGNGARTRGVGDADVDFKWRAVELDALTFGLRAGVGLPVGDVERGLSTGEPSYHATLIASFDAEPVAFHANLGVNRLGDVAGLRRNLVCASIAAVWTVREGLRLTAEVGAVTNPDPELRSWPAVARLGVIATIDEHWDVDFGVQPRLNRAAPDLVVLAGATLRW